MSFLNVTQVGNYSERQCRYGLMRWITNDVGVGRSLALYAEWSESEVMLWRGFIRPSDVVISAGANIGAHLIPLSKMAKHVYSAEPNPLLADLTVHNLRTNNIENVTLAVGAFSEKKGHGFIKSTPPDRNDSNYGGCTLVEQGRGDLQIPTMPIDEFGLMECAMIHLDVEGHELLALKGAADTIKRCKPILYVECDRERNNPELFSWIRNHDYQIALHMARLYNEQNYAEYMDDIFGPMSSAMALCIPDRGWQK